jgi:hypothetical protein
MFTPMRRALTFGLSETPVRSPSMWFWNADQTWRSARPAVAARAA